MYLAPQDNDMPPLHARDCVAIRHPGQVRRRRTRAGIQKDFDYIELSLDSGSRSAKRSSSGMTDLPNCDIVSVGKWHSLVFVFKSKICNLQSEI